MSEKMEYDYEAALEWFNQRTEFAVKHPQQIRHKDAIKYALKLAAKLEKSPALIELINKTSKKGD